MDLKPKPEAPATPLEVISVAIEADQQIDLDLAQALTKAPSCDGVPVQRP